MGTKLQRRARKAGQLELFPLELRPTTCERCGKRMDIPTDRTDRLCDRCRQRLVESCASEAPPF